MHINSNIKLIYIYKSIQKVIEFDFKFAVDLGAGHQNKCIFFRAHIVVFFCYLLQHPVFNYDPGWAPQLGHRPLFKF